MTPPIRPQSYSPENPFAKATAGAGGRAPVPKAAAPTYSPNNPFAPAPPSPEHGSWQDALATALSGGISSDLAGATSAVGALLHGDTDLGKNFVKARDKALADANDYATRHPSANAAIQAVGGTIPTAAAMLATGGAGSAAEGGAALAERAMPTLAQRLPARMLGGSAIGAAAEQASRFENAPGTLRQRAQAVQGAGLPLSGMLFGLASPAAPALASSIMDRLKGTPSADRALGKVLSTVQESGQTFPEVIHALIGAPEDVPVVLADGLGRPGRQLVRSVTDRGGLAASELQQKLETRQQGQYGRWRQNTTANMGQGFQSLPEAIDAATDARRTNANAAFGAAGMDRIFNGASHQAAMENPLYRKAIQIGQDITNTNALADRIKTGANAPTNMSADAIRRQFPDDPAMQQVVAQRMGVSLDAPQQQPQGVTYATLDNARQFLRKGIQSGFDAESGFNHTSARATQSLLNAVLDEATTANPKYGAALQQFGEDSRPIEALTETGKHFMNNSPAENRHALRGVAPNSPEMNAVRTAALADARDKMGSKDYEANLMNRWLNSPDGQENLTLLAPNADAAAKMQAFRDWEQKGALVNAAPTAGSNTSTNLAGLGRLGQGQTLMQMLATPGRAKRTIAGAVGAAIDAHRSQSLNDALAPLLGTERGGLTDLQRLLQAAQDRAALRTSAGKIASGTWGLMHHALPPGPPPSNGNQ